MYDAGLVPWQLCEKHDELERVNGVARGNLVKEVMRRGKGDR